MAEKKPIKATSHTHQLVPMKDLVAKKSAAAKKAGKTYMASYQSGAQGCSVSGCNYVKAPKSSR
jgi:hypothetical protein